MGEIVGGVMAIIAFALGLSLFVWLLFILLPEWQGSAGVMLPVGSCCFGF